MRSAIYVGATGGQRRRVHNALGAVTRRARDVDRRAWHLAAGCLGPDEDVALLLEQAAERARERGGYSARAAYLARAVDLTVDSDAWVQRSLLAAEAALMAGQPDQALSLLDRLDPATLADVDRGRQLMIKAFAQGFSGADAAMATVPAICQAAAAAFETAAPALARDALITAFERAFGAEWMMTGTTPAELAEHADRLRPPHRGQFRQRAGARRTRRSGSGTGAGGGPETAVGDRSAALGRLVGDRNPAVRLGQRRVHHRRLG